MVGRNAGTAPDHAYSAGVKNPDAAWTSETLDNWLTDPQGLIPGPRMGVHLGDAQKRADAAAYLAMQK